MASLGDSAYPEWQGLLNCALMVDWVRVVDHILGDVDFIVRVIVLIGWFGDLQK